MRFWFEKRGKSYAPWHGCHGVFLFLERIIMSESEFYKCISKVTGETNGMLRQMGFQYVETQCLNGRKFYLNGRKYSVRRDPPDIGKAGDK